MTRLFQLQLISLAVVSEKRWLPLPLPLPRPRALVLLWSLCFALWLSLSLQLSLSPCPGEALPRVPLLCPARSAPRFLHLAGASPALTLFSHY